LIRKLIDDKTYRDAYVFEHVRNGLAFQLRGIRDELGWSQTRMGQEVGKPQNVISRLEDPNCGRRNLQTLLEIASGLGVGLLVKFVPFSRLVREYEDVSPEALLARPVSDEQERQALETWAGVEAQPSFERPRAASSIPNRSFKLVLGGTETPIIQPVLPFDRPQLRIVPISPGTSTERPALHTNIQDTASMKQKGAVAVGG